jgi:hypothetical protein
MSNIEFVCSKDRGFSSFLRPTRPNANFRSPIYWFEVMRPF